MARKKSTLTTFQAAQLSEETAQQVKGGYKGIPGIPGGYGTTGLIDWGEVEIREGGLMVLPPSGIDIGSIRTLER
jgi:hypothetical protein